MMELKEVTLDQILAVSNTLPYSEMEIDFALGYIKTCQKKGRDLLASHRMKTMGEVAEVLNRGVMILSSRQLESEFLYIKINAGKGLFGGQKASYANYLGAPGSEEWAVGTVYKIFGIGVTAIGNLYRAYE